MQGSKEATHVEITPLTFFTFEFVIPTSEKDTGDFEVMNTCIERYVFEYRETDISNEFIVILAY